MKKLATFVTAKLKSKNDCRQGWIVCTSPLIIIGQSGERYECEGEPTEVVNPPDISDAVKRDVTFRLALMASNLDKESIYLSIVAHRGGKGFMLFGKTLRVLREIDRKSQLQRLEELASERRESAIISIDDWDTRPTIQKKPKHQLKKPYFRQFEKKSCANFKQVK